jgi:tetratricopeptide (TPR) repeat protein
MNRSLTTTLALSLCAVSFTGCATSHYGQEKRVEAKGRIDGVKAQLAYDQANDAFKVGEFQTALGHVDSAIAGYPTEPQFHILRGRILMEMSQLEPAADAFEAAIETQTGIDRAVVPVDKLTLLDTTIAEAHYYLGIIYQRWSNDLKSFENYQKAMHLDNTSVQYVLATAEALIALERLDEAEQLILPTMDRFEHNAALHHLLGQIALLKGESEQAVQKYEEARLLNPDDQGLLEELIWTQYGAGMYGKCHENIKDFQTRFNSDTRSDLRHLEARCLAMMDRARDARGVYLQLSREKPADADVWSELGAVAWELGDYRRVALCGVRVIALAPERYEGYLLKAINEQHHGNAVQAMELLREAADHATDTPLPHIMLGRALEQNGQLGEAILAYSTALQIQPNHPEAQILFASASVTQEQQEQQMTVVPTDGE